jgi:hypothetical protein
MKNQGLKKCDDLLLKASKFDAWLCAAGGSAVFMTGLTPDFAAENVGFFTAPYEVRGTLGKPVIDRANQTVDVKLPNGVTRTAKYLGSCDEVGNDISGVACAEKR